MTSRGFSSDEAVSLPDEGILLYREGYSSANVTASATVARVVR